MSAVQGPAGGWETGLVTVPQNEFGYQPRAAEVAAPAPEREVVEADWLAGSTACPADAGGDCEACQ